MMGGWTPYVLFATTMTAWLTLSTDFLINPLALDYNEETENFIFTRDPRIEITADWITDVRTEGGVECTAAGQSFYQKSDDLIVRYAPSPELLVCLRAEGAKLVTVHREGHIAGPFRLRGSTSNYTIE